MWINLDAFEQPKDVSPSFQIGFKHLQKCPDQVQVETWNITNAIFLRYLHLLSKKSRKGRFCGANWCKAIGMPYRASLNI